MFDLDKWQEIFNTIRKHKLRTFLTALGVFWGIFMLIILMGAGKGLENGVLGMFGGHAVNSMYVWPMATEKPYLGLPAGRRVRFSSQDIEAIQNRYEKELEYIAPRLYVTTGAIINGKNSGAFQVRGELPAILHIDAFTVDKGRFINQKDIDLKRKTAVIGRQVKKILFEEKAYDEVIGKYIKIRGAEYQIVGIFKSDRVGDNEGEDEEEIIIPLTTAQQITNQPNQISWFVCSMHKEIAISSIEPKITSLLKQRHKIAPDDKRGIGSENIEEQFKQFQGLFFGISLIVWIVGIGSLLAGVIGVGNIMLIVVKERKKEIGIRKAMGATPSSIVSMILLESVFITSIAGYLGLVCSVSIVYLMKLAAGDGGAFFANPEINMTVAIGAVIILIFSGALTGLLPALQAARINPVEALKDE